MAEGSRMERAIELNKRQRNMKKTKAEKTREKLEKKKKEANKNAGKVFEEQFKNSCPDYCFVFRLKDSATSFKPGAYDFSWNNPCDFLMFNTREQELYGVECKSTMSKSMSFEDVTRKDKRQGMIKHHQIKGLREMAEFEHINAGFLLNFRTIEIDDYDDEDEVGEIIQRTYFMPIANFEYMCYNIGKKSFNEIDLIKNGAIKVMGQRLRVNYRWDIEGMIEKINERNKESKEYDSEQTD